ncbi:MAG: hypothetical protein J6A28_01460 [Clostridia bacterium]|nr:hypothetical protein [Clostridia bacterium]
MTFKNSIKLLCANFTDAWKLLVYHIICIALCGGLLAIFAGQYIDFINIASAQVNLPGVFQSGTLYGASFPTALTTVVNFVLAFFSIMFVSNVGIGVFFCFIIFILLPFLFNVGKIVMCELSYGYMSACQKQSFTGTALKTLRLSLPYAAVKLVYSLPLNFIIALAVWGLTRIDFTGLEVLFPFVFVIAISLVCAFKQTVNAGWAPARVVYNSNIFKSYAIGVRAVARKVLATFSTALIIYLLAIVLSLVLGAYSIIIIVPIISPLLYIFEMTAFFQSQGMRFYVDGQTIFSPKKLEENDKIEDIKYLL